MKRLIMLGMAVWISFFTAACQKDDVPSERVNDILKQETYVKIKLGENYHQASVLFALEEEKSVVPKDVEWGLPKYRDKNTVGVSFGEEGTEVYETCLLYTSPSPRDS